MTTQTILKQLSMALALVAVAGVPASAQVPVDDDGVPIEALGPVDAADEVVLLDEEAPLPPPGDVVPLSDTELGELVGPVALYPDDLLAIVLPASTFPLQIVQAARFLEELEQDSTLTPDESWDESVIALLNYPDVIRLMNDDIDWTWQLGEAVIAQQSDVLQAVEQFRDRAYVAGNLQSDDHQTITMDEGIIEIVPIEDDVIYVPYYDPEVVVVEQPRREYYYYPDPYPVYYYPYPRSHSFASGYFWGVTTAFNIGWDSHHVRVHHPSYWGHPYYGRHYYDHYYRRPSVTVYNTTYINNSRYRDRHRRGDYWTPRRGSGARQSDYRQYTRSYRNDASRVAYTGDRSYDRRASNRGQPVADTRIRAREPENRNQTRSDRRERNERSERRERREEQNRSRGNSQQRRTTPVATAKREQRRAPPPEQTRRSANNRQERQSVPARQERRATPARQERQATPARQEQRATPTRQARLANTSRQERRATPARQERRATPARQERAATTQRQQRQERRSAPARQEKQSKPAKTERRQQRSERPRTKPRERNEKRR